MRLEAKGHQPLLFFLKCLDDEVDGPIRREIEVLAAIDELSRRATVFFSYAQRSRASTQMAFDIAKALCAKDYRVFFDIESLGPGASRGEQVAAALDDAMDQGFLLLLVSPEAFAADYVGMEVEYAVRRRAGNGRSSNVVALIVSERERTLSLLGSSSLGRTLGQIAPLDLTSGEFNDNFEKLLRVLAR